MHHAFPLRKPNPLTKILFSADSSNRDTLVQSDRLTFCYYFALRSFHELNCSALKDLTGRKQRAVQLRLSKEPLHATCTDRSGWPQQPKRAARQHAPSHGQEIGRFNSLRYCISFLPGTEVYPGNAEDAAPRSRHGLCSRSRACTSAAAGHTPQTVIG